jgi:hypothetical protein
MSKVVAIMSMSLDGYVADPDDGVAEVFDWYMNSGDVEFHTGGSDPMTFKVSEPSAKHLRGLWGELGAVLRSSTLRPPRRHASRPWQPDGDRRRRRYTRALPGKQGLIN